MSIPSIASSVNSLPILPSEMQLKIVDYAVGYLKAPDFKIVGRCSFLSKKINRHIELLCEKHSKEKGMNVSWAISREIEIGKQCHQWFFINQFFRLLRIDAITSIPVENSPHIKALKEKGINDCKGLLDRFSLLNEYFFLMEGDEACESSLCFSGVEQKDIMSCDERILQTFKNAIPEPLDIASLDSIAEVDPRLLPFITKMALSLGFRDLSLFFKRAIVLWQSGKMEDRNILESMLRNLLHTMRVGISSSSKLQKPSREQMDGTWVGNLLDDLCEEEQNRIPPIMFATACAHMHILYRDIRNTLPSTEIIKETRTFLDNFDIKTLDHRVLDSLIKAGASYCLDEPSPVDFLLEYVQKIYPNSLNVMLFQIAVEIRSKQFDQAEADFNNYIRCKFGKESLVERMNSNELEIYYFFQLRTSSSVMSLRKNLQDYRNFLHKQMLKRQDTLSLNFISHRYKVITESLLNLGNFTDGLTQVSCEPSTKSRLEFLTMKNGMMPLKESHNLMSVSGLPLFHLQYPDKLSFIVSNISKFSFNNGGCESIKKHYLSVFHELFSQSIVAWKNHELNGLEDALIILGGSSSAWALACLTKIYENLDNRIIPVTLSYINAIACRKYDELRFADLELYSILPEERKVIHQLPMLIKNLLHGDCLPKRFLLHILDYILESEAIDSLDGSESIADQILPLFLKMEHPPVQMILLQAKQKVRSNQIKEGEELFNKYLQSKPSNFHQIGEDELHLWISLKNEKYSEVCLDGNRMIEKLISRLPSIDMMDIRIFVRTCIHVAKAYRALGDYLGAKEICNKLLANVSIDNIRPTELAFINEIIGSS